MNNFQAYLKKHFSNKLISIYGLGREGLSTYQFFRKHLPEVVLHLVDDNATVLEKKPWSDLDLRDFTHFYQKDHYYDLMQNNESFEMPQTVYKSAGIPFTNELITLALRKETTVSSNTELCFELVKSVNEYTDITSKLVDSDDKSVTSTDPSTSPSASSRFAQDDREITTIGVTGTKGKSTTTALIHYILEDSGKHSVLGGNIGIPPLSALETLLASLEKSNYLTLELSSHQLQALKYSPHIAVLLDISPEHLDYYGSFEEYGGAKSNISRHQSKNDAVVFNNNHKLPSTFASLSNGKKAPISSKDISDIDLTSYKLKGRHNQENIAIALQVAELLQIDKKKAIKSTQGFAGLPHRLEFVTQHKGVKYYNDSLATTPVATIAALKAFSDQEVILIVGGYDRGLDFSELVETISQSSVTLVLGIGQTGKNIVDLLDQTEFKGIVNYVETLEVAVAQAQKKANIGSVVLMSPASASFDQFKDYVDRGNTFKELTSK